MTLREYRKHHRITQAAMALMLGVTQPTISKYERGRLPSPNELRRLMQVTGGAVTAADFPAEQRVAA